MRLVAWNCNMALHRKLAPLLALRPDVAVLQMAAFLVRVKKDLLGFRGKVQLGRLRYAIAENDPFFYLTADGIDRKSITERQKPG